MSNVPALRFGEFDEDWEVNEFGKLNTRITDSYNPVKSEDNYKCIELENISQGSGLILGHFLSKNQKSIKTLFQSGDVLFGKLRPYLRKFTQVPFSGVCSTEIWVLRSKGGNNAFLKQLVQTGKFYKAVNIQSGSKMPRADWKLVSATVFKIPSLPEQKKIANFLSAVDSKIELLGKKKALLEQYKKGAASALFNGQLKVDNGKLSTSNAQFSLRFKDASTGLSINYPDWEVKRLGDVASRQITKNTDSAINRVLTNSATKGILDQQDYFDKDIANANNLMGYYIVDEGDYVYNPRISVHAPVGPINKNKIGKGVMSPLYSVFRFKSESNTFYEQYFRTALWYKYMKSVANYGARHDRMNISTVDFMALPLPSPCIEEQGKITVFLVSLDKKIEATQAQINQTEQFKKGLLQKMFV